jgi:hypothetical protein
MRLFKQEADLFFELMWALQFFVNQKLNILPAVTTLEKYIAGPLEEKSKVRKALYENKQLIDLFVQENPHNFPQDRLLIVSKWRNFVQGEFYIERFLKKHAIFISKENQVYAVCGLYQDLDEMIDPYDLPLYVQAVLLPFAGKIIYDGLFQTYNISFGGGIRGNLKESYMIAKQNNRVIETFEPQLALKPAKAHVLKDWGPEINDLYEKAKHLKAGPNYPLTYGAAFGLVRAGLEFAQTVVSDPKDLDALYKSLKKAQRELNKAYKILNREES